MGGAIVRVSSRLRKGIRKFGIRKDVGTVESVLEVVYRMDLRILIHPFDGLTLLDCQLRGHEGGRDVDSQQIRACAWIYSARAAVPAA